MSATPPACSTCRWAKAHDWPLGMPDGWQPWLTCQYHAPSRTGPGNQAFATVQADDFCREWEAK